MQRRTTLTTCLLLCGTTTLAVSATTDLRTPQATATAPPELPFLTASPPPASPPPPPTPITTPPPPTTPPGPITVAIGGDSNTTGASVATLRTKLASVGTVMSAADIAIVNVETALGNKKGLTPGPKKYTFMAAPEFLDVLGEHGVDAVSLANNHGLDFGRKGLTQTLAARTADRPTMLGVGANDAEAWKPHSDTINGRNVTVFGVNDVLDNGFAWHSGPTTSGMAIVKSEESLAKLRSQVRAHRAEHPTGVSIVYLHAGVERVVCPTQRQRRLATELAADGASIVAMAHAHVLQPAQVIGSTQILYGLGNFIFATRSAGVVTGLAEVTVPVTGAPALTWHPATLSHGVPTLMPPQRAKAARNSFNKLTSRCALP